jgi:hypothetical protein
MIVSKRILKYLRVQGVFQRSMTLTKSWGNQLNKREDFFGIYYWRFQSVVAWPTVFGPVVRQ